jgi:hypothetical protein
MCANGIVSAVTRYVAGLHTNDADGACVVLGILLP